MSSIDEVYDALLAGNDELPVNPHAIKMIVARAQSAVHDPDPKNRFGALRIARLIGGSQERSILETFTGDEDLTLRKTVYDRSLELGEDGLPVLRRMVADPDPSLAVSVIRLLTRRADKASTTRMRTLLRSKHAVVRGHALIFLSHNAGPSVYSHVRRLENDPDERVRAVVKWTMDGLDGKEVPAHPPAFKPHEIDNERARLEDSRAVEAVEEEPENPASMTLIPMVEPEPEPEPTTPARPPRGSTPILLNPPTKAPEPAPQPKQREEPAPAPAPAEAAPPPPAIKSAAAAPPDNLADAIRELGTLEARREVVERWLDEQDAQKLAWALKHPQPEDIEFNRGIAQRRVGAVTASVAQIATHHTTSPISWQRSHGAEVLGALGGEDAQQAVAALLKDKEAHVRAAAVQAMAILGLRLGTSAWALEQIKGLSHERESVVREALSVALELLEQA